MSELSDSALRHLRGALERPETIGERYDVAEELGRGGMGAVFRAYDRELDRDVAIKVLARAELDPRATERLQREARIAARLEHPGIVPVYDVGALDDGRPYYVMKLVAGARLDELIASERASDERIDVFLKLCDAVAYAHARGVVHRDLKPENVRVGAFGEVQVLDFGVAKELGAARAEGREQAVSIASTGSTAHEHAPSSSTPGPSSTPPRSSSLARAQTSAVPATRAGAVVGTPGWMAPEQERGEPDVDARADVYALGRLLHALMGPNPRVPARRLAAIVARATADARDARYPTVEALAADVRRLRAGEAVSAHQESFLERALRVAERHQTAIAIVLAYLALRILFVFYGRS
ncbi:MAG: serine/threonine protein kinase [Planctomycetes bacterium]|nr:serine/threonine protein kinase [Planctomycetota bacterium]